MPVTTKKRATKRQYSDEKKADTLLVLEANGGNVKRTARDTGIPYKTVASWRDGLGVVPEVADIRDRKRAPLADRLRELAHDIVDSMGLSKDGANFQQHAVGLGIVLDKAQLLDGQPTSISENRGDSPGDTAERLSEILLRAKEAREKTLDWLAENANLLGKMTGRHGVNTRLR